MQKDEALTRGYTGEAYGGWVASVEGRSAVGPSWERDNGEGWYAPVKAEERPGASRVVLVLHLLHRLVCYFKPGVVLLEDVLFL